MRLTNVFFGFLAVAATQARAGDAPCYKGDPKICRIEVRIAELTNAHRSDQGLTALSIDPKMAFVARDWSTKQAGSGDISHNGFPDSREQVYVSEFGSIGDIFIAGENVAMFTGADGQSEEAIAKQLTEQWWESQGHRDNMLGRYAAIGVGVTVTKDGAVYGTQDFYNHN